VARDRWRVVDSPAGPIRALLPPIVLDGREAPMGSIPEVGRDNLALREELSGR